MPYGLDAQADSKEKARRIIEDLVSVYEQRLKKYSYPEHLVKGKLFDKEDRGVFVKVWPKVSVKISEMIKKTSYNSYENVIGGEKKITLNDVFVTYSNRSYSPSSC